jgi:FkbM family methyltransferase
VPTATSEARRKLSKLAHLVREREYLAALRHRVAAAVEHEHVVFGTEPRLVLDVGANRGQFALFALHRFPDADVHCFEPVPAALDTLRAVVGQHPRITIHPIALGRAAGEAMLHVSASDDSSSLLPASALLRATYPQTRQVGEVSVRTDRLDQDLPTGALRSPCLLKIDVQGFEMEVLVGATELLPHIDEILVECSFVELYGGQPLADEVIGYLFEHGFRLRGVYGLSADDTGRSLQADLLFARADAGEVG